MPDISSVQSYMLQDITSFFASVLTISLFIFIFLQRHTYKGEMFE